MFLNLIGWLLHNANSGPPFGNKKEFYLLKDRILRLCGTCTTQQVNLFTKELTPAVQYQHFEKKDCFHCGSSYWCDDCADLDHCCRCDGSGIYLPECWVELWEYSLGKYRFHIPKGKIYIKPGQVDFEGKIHHQPKAAWLPEECYLWLCLFFNQRQFIRYLGVNGRYGKVMWNRPMIMLSTFVQACKNHPWKFAQLVLPHRLYFKMRWQWFYKEPQTNDDIPF